MKTTPPWSRRRWTQPGDAHALARGPRRPRRRCGSDSASAPIIRQLLDEALPGAPARCSPLVHVAHRGHTVLVLARADDHRVAGAQASAACRIMRLQAAPAQVALAAQPGGAQPLEQRQQLQAQVVVEHRDVAVERRLALGALERLERQHDPLDAGAEADARGGRPAERLDQAVVAPAPAHGALGAQVVAGELEDGHRVVVEAAHEGRSPPRRRSPGASRASSTRSRWAWAAGERWSSSFGAPAMTSATRGSLVSNRRSGLSAHALARVLVERLEVPLEVVHQQLAVGPAALGVAHAAEPQAHARHPEARGRSRPAARSPRRRAAGRRCRSPRPRTASARGSGPAWGAS